MKISMTVLHYRAIFDILGTILDKANQGGLKEQERDGRGEKDYDFCVHNTIEMSMSSLNESDNLFERPK